MYPWGRQVARDQRVNVLPRPWVAQRTFVRLGNGGSLSEDAGALPETTEVRVYLVVNRLMVKPLTRAPVAAPC